MAESREKHPQTVPSCSVYSNTTRHTHRNAVVLTAVSGYAASLGPPATCRARKGARGRVFQSYYTLCFGMWRRGATRGLECGVCVYSEVKIA